MDVITAAIAAGAVAGLTDVAGQAVREAYERLRTALGARFPALGVHVQALETRPDSPIKQSSLSEELVEAGARDDAELLHLARALLDAVRRDAPEAAVRAGVDLERLAVGGSLDIEDAAGDDVGVRGRDIQVRGDLHIGRARGGRGPDPNP